MTDDIDIPEIDCGNPTGYVRHQESTDALKAVVCSATAPVVSQLRGKSQGISYCNLTDYAAQLLATGQIVTSQRALITVGSGKILTPLAQQTGICDGCSFGEATFIAWCARYCMYGFGELPRECSFMWSYLGGRQLQITGHGDSGASPPYSAQQLYSIGALPVDVAKSAGSQFDLASMPPHGPNSQEALCIKMRDNPILRQQWIDAAAPFKCAVYSPGTAEDIADCIVTGRPVTFGAQVQGRETQPGSSGVSSLYRFPNGGGHETFASGFYRYQGALNFIKTESWWNALYPASKWPNNLLTVMTDDGLKTLYPGQSVVPADKWMRQQPECWAIDGPGSRN